MGLILNGNAPNKILYNGAEVSLYFNGSKIWPAGDPYNPLNLPPNTVRVRTSDGNAPIKGSSTTYETATLVTGTNDVYDIYKSGTDFGHLLQSSTNLVEVLGANTTGITSIAYMFESCSSLTTIQVYNTLSVTNMNYLFAGCASLIAMPQFDTSNVKQMISMCEYCIQFTSVPLFNTSKATHTRRMFADCKNVQSGALALYNQLSTQATPPTSHTATFRSCGSNTTTGAAELAQIPSGWK